MKDRERKERKEIQKERETKTADELCKTMNTQKINLLHNIETPERHSRRIER